MKSGFNAHIRFLLRYIRMKAQTAQKQRPQNNGGVTDADIEHYQKIIVVLVETDRIMIMREIDHITI